MLKIKRLYIYILQSFVPVFLMTFGICLFIVLMQFLWKYVEDLVGKGISVFVLSELFGYAALTLIPIALPLAILLASLMSFGSLGENLELLAVKGSGISLLKTMRPLIIFVLSLAVGMFFFQNDAMPKIQVKFRSLFFSIKQKSPELDIPEGTFYNEINGYNLFVKKKDKKTKVLHEVMIYSTAQGIDNMAVIVSDSAKMLVSSHQDYLKLILYNGQQFSNFKQGNTSGFGGPSMVPYARENFKTKDIVIPFDSKFNRVDESSMSNSQLSKNIQELSASIDSMKEREDSMNQITKKAVLISFNSSNINQIGEPDVRIKAVQNGRVHTPISETKAGKKPDLKNIKPIQIDTLVDQADVGVRNQIVMAAISKADMSRFSSQTFLMADIQRQIRSYQIEWFRKFTLSLACIIFFFIGAPLGAIIRKGGLGMPVVISVILFIIYYVVDNIGYKMARDGVWSTWSGMLLSSFVLAPLGVFLTYKAMIDSGLMNADAYRIFFKKLVGKTEKRNLSVKGVAIYSPNLEKVKLDLISLEENVEAILPRFRVRNYIDFWRKMDWDRGLERVSTQLENIVEDVSNSKNSLIVKQTSEFPVMSNLVTKDIKERKWGIVLGIFFILGIPLYLWIIYKDIIVKKSLRKILAVSRSLRLMMAEELSEKNRG